MPFHVIAVTNPIRAVAPFATFTDDPGPFFASDVAIVKSAILYADHVELRSYLADVGTFAELDVTAGDIPLAALRIILSLAQHARRDILARYGLPPEMIPSKKQATEWVRRASTVRKANPEAVPLVLVRLIMEELGAEFAAFARVIHDRYFSGAATWASIDATPFQKRFNVAFSLGPGGRRSPQRKESRSSSM
jgi:hypothetical protein